MTGNKDLFSSYKPFDRGNVLFGSNTKSKIIGKGTISHNSLNINDVSHVENLSFNLLIIDALCLLGLKRLHGFLEVTAAQVHNGNYAKWLGSKVKLFTYKEEMAPVALSDTKVNNDKSCSKTCLTNYETLKKQYDDLIFKLHEIEFKAATYKKGLATVEDQLITFRKNEVLFSKEVAVLKREIEKFENASKDLDKLLGSQITDNSKKGLGYHAVPPPHPLIYNAPTKLDLSYSGLEEFQQPEFEGYGLRANKKWVSDNKDEVESPVVVEKKTVVPTIPKVDVVRPKQ
ncbi:hypothetical protein Tco_0468218 [Tanacetum coccineum]